MQQYLHLQLSFLITFMVYGQRFRHAYQHLEKIGKLRHARFTNTRDVVPLIPFHGIVCNRSYKHVGMHIRLHGVHKYAQYWLRQALDVTYPKHQGLLSELWRGFKSSFIRNLNSPEGMPVLLLILSEHPWLKLVISLIIFLHSRLQAKPHLIRISKAYPLCPRI